MNKKNIVFVRLFVLLAVLAVAVYFSFYTEPLSERLLRERMKKFRSQELVDYHWNTQRENLPQRALSLKDLKQGLQQNPSATAEKYGKVPGIGYHTLFLIKDSFSSFQRCGDFLRMEKNGTVVMLPVVYVFGNVARDATDWFSIDDFLNTMEYNEISSYINDLIITKVVDSVIPYMTDYKELFCCGAVALSLDNLSLDSLEMIPLVMEGK